MWVLKRATDDAVYVSGGWAGRPFLRSTPHAYTCWSSSRCPCAPSVAPPLPQFASPPTLACLPGPAGWAFYDADPMGFRRAMGDALYTWREHRTSFKWVGECQWVGAWAGVHWGPGLFSAS